jgi:2,3-diketo-5-methylthio-1-phosphopentane phosphatase
MSADRLEPARLHVFSDFDGTITERDTLVFLTERLGGGARMRQVNDRLATEGKISLRQCIAGNMRSIRAPFSEAVRLLRENIGIDPSFAGFARWCAARGIPLTVLSAGFKEIVDLYLSPADFPGLEVRANQLVPDERKGWQCVFRDRTAFGHDKAEPLREAHRRGSYTVFIGDGISDRAPAAVADEVFAKPDLARYCRDRGIRCHEFGAFDEVTRKLAERLSTT